jgi:guanylate kinase
MITDNSRIPGKVVIFSAPSGSGKTTIYNRVKDLVDNLGFSVSATSRPPRENEENGKSYWFITVEQFMEKIKNDEFVEYEEVYPGKFYGTLKSEVEEKLMNGINLAFDVDVHGALKIKRLYGENALAIFIQPPSIDELRRRLELRGTDSKEVIEERIKRATYELSRSGEFDKIVVNDDLETAVKETYELVVNFLNA